MSRRTIILCVLLVLLVGCPRTKPAPPEPAGAAQTVDGEGLVTAGNNAETRVVVADDTGEEYCLIGELARDVEVGDRVRFRGDRSAVLPLKGEHCMRLDLVELTVAE